MSKVKKKGLCRKGENGKEEKKKMRITVRKRKMSALSVSRAIHSQGRSDSVGCPAVAALMAQGDGRQSETWQMNSYTYQDEHVNEQVNVHNTYKHNMIYT